jgi:para-aminobenzoate synthetase / 4-amino-4-deoxychorismate lyase
LRAAEPRRLVRRALDWELSPADVLRRVRGDPYPVALLGAWAGGSDIVASGPLRTCGAPEPWAAALDEPLPEETGPGFGGGWIGYLGFGLADQVLPVPPAPGEARRLPAWWLGYYDHVLRRDRATGRWTFEALWTPARAAALEARFAELTRRADTPPRDYSCGPFSLIPSAAEHQAAVWKAIDYIRRGDIFQANICLRLEASFSGDPLDAFCRAATRLDPPFAAFLRLPGGAVASLSPELFLRRTGTAVWSRPIKGTRSRPSGEQAAQRERAALERSAKDRAENMMIVDLMRNDLSRVCMPGSVRVPARLRAEAHPGVWHLVSDVRGRLPAGVGDGRLIAAAFPPGSVTGAPKVRALEVIHDLEATPREVYTGAIGYRSPVAGLELNVAIRTFEFADGRVWLGSGGGIVAASEPAAEYRECLAKATPLIGALGATLSEEPGVATEQAGSAPRPVAPGQRPRPARGVFTSLRVTDGRAPDLSAHLTRLAESVGRLYGKPLPPGLSADLAALLPGRSGRLRITARPAGGPLHVAAEVVPAGPVPLAVTLRLATIPGGLGPHKWTDRRLLAALAGRLGPDQHLLIADRDGQILETDRASVFAVIDGVLRTPPADGRILPGITRAAVLELAARDGLPVLEEPITAPRLLEATEVFVTNSVAGLVPARSLDQPAASWSAGPWSSRLRTALASRALRPVAVTQTRLEARTRAGDATTHSRRLADPSPMIVLIDNYDSFTYNLAHLLLGDQCQVEVVRNDEVTVADIARLRPDGIVISPGPGTPAAAGISVAAVRGCAATTPLLGICLGHQAIAAAYGAQITTAPQPVHGQAATITHDGRGLLSGLPPRFRAARYHSLIVDEPTLPPALVVTARGPGGMPMGLRHAEHPAEGVQFHPESILTPQGRYIMRNFVTTVVTARRGPVIGRPPPRPRPRLPGRGRAGAAPGPAQQAPQVASPGIARGGQHGPENREREHSAQRGEDPGDDQPQPAPASGESGHEPVLMRRRLLLPGRLLGQHRLRAQQRHRHGRVAGFPVQGTLLRLQRLERGLLRADLLLDGEQSTDRAGLLQQRLQLGDRGLRRADQAAHVGHLLGYVLGTLGQRGLRAQGGGQRAERPGVLGDGDLQLQAHRGTRRIGGVDRGALARDVAALGGDDAGRPGGGGGHVLGLDREAGGVDDALAGQGQLGRLASR